MSSIVNLVKHLHLIFVIIYLSGAGSVELDVNFTRTATSTKEATEETTRTTTDGPKLLQNGSYDASPGVSEVYYTNKSAVGRNVLILSTECSDEIESDGNVTATYDELIDGNATVIPKKLVFDHSDCIDLGLRETAGFVAIGFLTFSVFGYVGFVLWRRYLQNKYGNGQTLITEDVYDISDLRHFEI